jgi:hypothetical protein
MNRDASLALMLIAFKTLTVNGIEVMRWRRLLWSGGDIGVMSKIHLLSHRQHNKAYTPRRSIAAEPCQQIYVEENVDR